MPPLTTRRPTTRAKPRKRSPGRPSTGVLERYKPILIYLDPTMLDAVDRQADREQRATGQAVARVDIIRQAITQYLAAQEATP
jgi:hypothetical protein